MRKLVLQIVRLTKLENSILTDVLVHVSSCYLNE